MIICQISAPMNRLLRTIFMIITVTVILLPAIPAIANKTEKNTDLRYNYKLDLTAIGLSSFGWGIMEIFKNDISPSSCRWCNSNSLDTSIRNNVKWNDTHAAEVSSTALAYGVAPILSTGLTAFAEYKDNSLDNLPVDVMIIAEAATLSSFFSQIVKISVARQRPDVHFGPTTSPDKGKNISFYSGHTSLAFSIAVATGTVAQMRGYELAPVIWGTGLAVAATTGYLRMAADKHYFTDVLGGAVLGSAFGFAVPYIFHRPKSKPLPVALSVTPTNGGTMFGISGNL